VPRCSFCQREIETGTGKMFVRGDGKLFYFCGSKCHANFRLGREPALVGWVRKKKK
jgi:large subunit ribosomal protein L24e